MCNTNKYKNTENFQQYHQRRIHAFHILHVVVELDLGQVLHLDLLGVVDDELVVLEVVAGHLVHVSLLSGSHRKLQTVLQCLELGRLHLPAPHNGLGTLRQLVRVVVSLEKLVLLPESHLTYEQKTDWLGPELVEIEEIY